MIVKEEYHAPFGEIPELRLSLIKRWGIIKMSREQSVAEHSYNTAIIAMKLYDILEGESCCVPKNKLIVDALLHDCGEIYTGDIPSPAKDGESTCTNPIIKLADLMESMVFFRENCVDTEKVKRWINFNLHSSISKICMENGYNHNMIIALMEGVSI